MNTGASIQQAGAAYARAVRFGERTILTHARANSPLHLLTPRAAHATAWLVTSTFGGGLIGGDHVALDLRVESGARVLVTSQASTKVYRSDRLTRQTLQAHVADGALLTVLPEPIVPFAGSRFEQRQRYQLEAGASLIALDSMTSGRHARGEHWQFDRYASRIDIERDGRAIFFDHLSLSQRDGCVRDRMGSFTSYALLVIIGAVFEPLVPELLAAVAAEPADPRSDQIVSAAPIDGGRGVALRLAARHGKPYAPDTAGPR